jgi:formylmethanofuran dehydrogenase subunit C
MRGGKIIIHGNLKSERLVFGQNSKDGEIEIIGDIEATSIHTPRYMRGRFSFEGRSMMK